MSSAVLACAADPCPKLRAERAKLDRFASDAVMAGSVYDPPGQRAAPPGYHEVTDPGKLIDLGLHPDDLSPKGSAFRAAVFEGPGGDTVVAFKGTTFYSYSDWKNNAQQAVGGNAEYYTHAQKIAKQMQQSGASPRFVGHSLGGGLASAAAKAIGADATTFNAAGLNNATVLDPLPGGHIDAVNVRGDILTSVQRGPLARAAASEVWSLDPPSGIGARLVRGGASVVAGLLGSAGGPLTAVGAAVAARGVMLHLMGSVEGSIADRIRDVDDRMIECAC